MSMTSYTLAAEALDSATQKTGAGSALFSVGPIAMIPGSGATVNGTTYGLNANDSIAAAQMFNQYVGGQPALNVQRWYMTETESYASLPAGLSALLNAGCGIQLCVKPSRTVTSATKSSLSSFLGLVASAMEEAGTPQSATDVSLWCEPDITFATSNPGITFAAYWADYQPVIKDAGFKVCYNSACNLESYADAISYFQSLTILPDKFGVDWYGTPWSNSIFPDQTPSGMSTNLMALADANDLPFGWFEYGSCSNGAAPLTQTQWGQFMSYGQNLFTTRTSKGKKNANIIYFGTAGTGTNGDGNAIFSSSDFRCGSILQTYRMFT
jgi:hypothetical protein